VRNEEECVCSVCLFRRNIFIGFRIIKEMSGLVGSGTPYIIGVTGKIGYELQNSVWCEDLSSTVLQKPVWEMMYLYKELDL